MSKIFIPSVASGCVLAMAAAAGFASTYQAHDVNLSVDGKTSTIHQKAPTVGALLKKQGITVGQHDQVTPALDTPLDRDMDVTVLIGKPLNLTVDGVNKQVWTTAATVEQALQQISTDFRGAKLSTSRSTPIGREGLTLEVATQKNVTVIAGGQTKQTRHAGTVQDVLRELNISTDADDIVTPAPSAMLQSNMRITVVNVEYKTVAKTSEVPFEKITKQSPELLKGKKKVTTKGQLGTKVDTYAQVLHDGKVVSNRLTSSKVTKQPVTEVTTIGTAEAIAVSGADGGGSTGNGGPLNLARAAMWDRIAQCESSGNWSINTGNGYYGGLQFNLQTWRSVNGQDFAAYPHQASRAEQITVANRLYAKRGLQPWGCRHAA